MLSIKINNQALDLSDNTIITTETQNPMFLYEEASAALTYPIQLPITRKNRKLLNYPHISNSNFTKEFKAELYWKSIHIDSCMLELNGKKNGYYEADLHSGRAAFAVLARDKKLSDLDMGTLKVKSTGSFAPDDSEYARFPVYNPDFFKDSYLEAADQNPSYNGIFVNLCMRNAFMDISNNIVNLTKVSLYPYLYKVLEKMFKAFNFQVTENVFANHPLNHIVIYHNIHAGQLEVTNHYGNSYEVGVKTDNIPLNKQLPANMKVAEFIHNLENYFNVCFLFSKNKVRIVKVDSTFESQRYYDINTKPSSQIETEYLKPVKSISIKSTLDETDMMYKDFKDLDPNAEILDHSDTYFYTMPDDVPQDKAGVVLIRNMGGINYANSIVFKIKDYTPTINQFVMYWNQQIVQGLSTKDTALLYSYVHSNSELTIENSISIPVCQNFDKTIIESWRILSLPTVKQQGSHPIREGEQPDCGLRLLFYLGQKPIPSPADHSPMHMGGSIASDNSMVLGYWGEIGIINKFWKHTLDFLKNLTIKIKLLVLMNEKDLLSLDFATKIKYKSQLYILLAKKVTYTKDKLHPVELTLTPYRKHIKKARTGSENNTIRSQIF